MRRWMKARLRWLHTQELGEVYVEYVVLGALAVLVILGAIQYFFGVISGLFQRIGDGLFGL